MSTRTHLGFQMCVCLKNLFYIFIITKLIKIMSFLFVIMSSTMKPLSETPCCYGSIRRTLTPLVQTPSFAPN